MLATIFKLQGPELGMITWATLSSIVQDIIYVYSAWRALHYVRPQIQNLVLFSPVEYEFAQAPVKQVCSPLIELSGCYAGLDGYSTCQNCGTDNAHHSHLVAGTQPLS